MYNTMTFKHSRLDNVLAQIAADRIDIAPESLLQIKGNNSWVMTLIDVFLK